jgi:GNAT superfamily N-acetyltransferase
VAQQGEISVKIAGTGEGDDVFETIVAAFADDPVVRWTFPDPEAYRAHFPGFARAFAGRALAAGGAYCTEDVAGAALWLPPGTGPDEEAMAAIVVDTMSEAEQSEIFALMEQMGPYHPHEPHWYLPLIGVLPAVQGRGYGSALLATSLARCDADGVPAYLEATSVRNVPLYERHGFVRLGTIQAGSSPPLVPMLRESRQRK